ncbi:MAG TPA: type II toxin-antitoxin system VapC family toxin [Gemmataceae bacterium]|nr:type II toxin-antitoxin system VapC family toxin [Gemmataceae bacterium]
MILLDTDHLTVLKYDEHPQCRALRERMSDSEDPDFATSIISAEEQMRGWLAKIHATRDAEKQVAWYDQLAWLIEFLADWHIIAFDQQAVVEFKRLQRMRLRIGTMDLKIAAIARVHDALLLSNNQRDFGRVPGLQVESWIA